MQVGYRYYATLVFLVFILAFWAVAFINQHTEINIGVLEKELQEQNFVSEMSRVKTIARAVSVYDVTLGREVYGRNSEAIMPIASLAKTMTVALALNYKYENDKVRISNNAVGQVGDHGLFAGEYFKVKDLAMLTLIASVNDGAYALGENNKDFISQMNAKARRIGMEHAVFLNKTGLDLNPAQPGAYASALDANIMAAYALRQNSEIFSKTMEGVMKITSLSGFLHEFKNTNVVLDKIPNLVFSKTGYTELAGGNLTVGFRDRNNHLVLVTVLGSTFEGRFSDMEKIVEALYNI